MNAWPNGQGSPSDPDGMEVNPTNREAAPSVVKAPTWSDPDEFVRRCLNPEFTEGIESRAPAGIPGVAGLIEALGQGAYLQVVHEGRALLNDLPDFDAVYRLVGAALRAMGDSAAAAAVLAEGLARARRKSLLLTDLGDTAAQAGDTAGAVYWWAQAVQCLAKIPAGREAFQSLGCLAGALGMPETEQTFRGQADTHPVPALPERIEPSGYIVALLDQRQREALHRVLDGLHYGLGLAWPPTAVDGRMDATVSVTAAGRGQASGPGAAGTMPAWAAPQADRPSAPPPADRPSAPPPADRPSAPPPADRPSAPPQADRASAPPQADRASAPPPADRASAAPQAGPSMVPALGARCPHCGADLYPADRFCAHCAQPVQPGQVTAPMPPPGVPMAAFSGPGPGGYSTLTTPPVPKAPGRRGLMWAGVGLAVLLIGAVAIWATRPSSPVASGTPTPAAATSTAQASPDRTRAAASVPLKAVERDPATDSAVGQCWDDEFDVVGCDSLHEYEVFGVAEILTDDLPSEDDLSSAASDFCANAFSDYVSRPDAPLPSAATYWLPDEDTWADGDHGVVCLTDEEPSVKGSLKER